MSTQVEDFWPAEIEEEALVTPAAILREQAQVLARRTNGLIEAEVSTTSGRDGRISHRFDLVAPALGDYHYELFRINHPVTLYPVRIDNDATEPASDDERMPFVATIGIIPAKQLKTEAEFKDWLKAKLASNHTKMLLSALLAQSKA